MIQADFGRATTGMNPEKLKSSSVTGFSDLSQLKVSFDRTDSRIDVKGARVGGALGDGTSVANLDRQGVEVQIAAERALDSTSFDPNLRHVYLGRNRFELRNAIESETYRDERLSRAANDAQQQGQGARLSPNAAVFMGTGGGELTAHVCRELGVCPGKAIVESFPNSETRVEVLESVRGKHAFVVVSMEAPVNESVMEAALTVQALKLADAGEVTVIAPYLGYSRQDRKTDMRSPISARVVLDLLAGQGADRIITVDVHAAQIEGFFKGPFENLSGLHQIIPALISKEGTNLVVVSPDAGGSKRAEAFSRRLEEVTEVFSPLVIMSKFRPGPGMQPRVTLNLAEDELAGKTCVIVDDMIDTGGSMEVAARALKDRGAAKVIIAATHGIFSNGAVSRLRGCRFERGERNEALIDRMYVTDSLPLRAPAGDFIHVVSLAPLLAEVVRRLDSGTATLRELRDRCDLGRLVTGS